VYANNIQVSNISLVDQQVDVNTVFVQFDLSWENSWRVSGGPANYDAAWVFLKYRISGGQWNHLNIVYVDGTNDGHSAPSGATIETVPGGTGCFIFRSSDGAGNNNFQPIKLLWDYNSTGLGDDALVEVKVFAIEMVYVPEGAFYLGTGTAGTEIDRFYNWSFGFEYNVGSENEITVAQSVGALYYDNVSSSSGDQSGPIPAAFPKGYQAFYSMKYEASQAQWVVFFNTLTDIQKPAHDVTDLIHKSSDNEIYRNGIAWTTGPATTTLPYVPVSFLSWSDITAYLDWAGLRPLTELEYEKACRGPLAPVPGEFAWGNSEYPFEDYTLLNPGTNNEVIGNSIAELPGMAYDSTAFDIIFGPVRCGIFAASAINKNRIETGGSYYGIMELSGNMSELSVSVGSADGRSFTGNNGDGVLSVTGLSNVSNWPAEDNWGVASRSSAWIDALPYQRVSDRTLASLSIASASSYFGLRGGRTK